MTLARAELAFLAQKEMAGAGVFWADTVFSFL